MATSITPTESVRNSEALQQQSLQFGGFIDNGSFENGNFSGWRTIGDTSIETIEIGIAPTDGEFQALIANGFRTSGGSVVDSDLSEFFDIPSGSLDGLLSGDATEGSGIKNSFFANAGDILEFDYSFLTNEGTPSPFNDSAFFTLGGFTQELSDTSEPTFSDKSVDGFSQATDPKTFKVAIGKEGTYDLGLGVVDLTDSIVDSGLLVDNVKLTSSGSDPISGFSLDGASTATTDDAISPSVDFVLGENGFEPVRGSSV